MGEPGDAWEFAALVLANDTGRPIENCRDDVAADALSRGEFRPLLKLLLADRHLPPVTAGVLAAMIDPDHYGIPLERLPYALDARRRSGKGGRPKDIEKQVFSEAVGRWIDARIRSGEKGDAALQASVQEIPGVNNLAFAKRALNAFRKAQKG